VNESTISKFKMATRIAYDTVICVTSCYIAMIIRFDFSLNWLSSNNFYSTFATVIIFNNLSLILLNLYKGLWRYSSIPDLLKIIQATSIGTIAAILFLFFSTRLNGVPRSFFLLYWLFNIVGLGGGRLAYKIISERLHPSKRGKTHSTLIVGAGDAGEQIYRETIKNKSLRLTIEGFVDDDPAKQNRTLLGKPILGQVHDLPSLIEKFSIEQVFIAIPSANGSQIRRIMDFLKDIDVKVKTLPRLNDLTNVDISMSLLRKVKPEDLLGREPVQLDFQAIGNLINKRKILITGAGGSIGSELCRQICRFNPEQIILFEVSELFLFNLENQLRRLFPTIRIVPIIGDIRNRNKVNHIFSLYKPDLVFHAAAYKHVPLMENAPIEAIYTNIIGTKILAEACGEYEVEQMVLISTDKAVNPTNIMGSTKRVAEMICKYYGIQHTNRTNFTIVRFGNVLGSNGSVIPTFKAQIEKGGPITVTHPDITRYFMSIPEASQLVLQAASLSNGGEIFVLDMGSPIKILDLAKEMISLAGLTPEVDIPIKIIGLRPGEKMYEELFSSNEKLAETTHSKVKMAISRNLPHDFEAALKALLDLNESSHKKEVLIKLKNLVPEADYKELKSPTLNDGQSIH
jgi:FlaA1/EpsC-like NDP-sugar epimerase